MADEENSGGIAKPRSPGICTWAQVGVITREICEIEKSLRSFRAERNRKILNICEDYDSHIERLEGRLESLFDALDRFAAVGYSKKTLLVKRLQYGKIVIRQGVVKFEPDLAVTGKRDE